MDFIQFYFVSNLTYVITYVYYLSNSEELKIRNILLNQY
jgi:hypothetical protein